MPPRHSASVAVLLLSALAFLLVSDAPVSTMGAPQDPGGLFVAAPETGVLAQGAQVRTNRPAVMRSRWVTINPAVWPDSRGADPRSAPATLLLNLFDDVSYTAVLDRLEPTSNGFTWIGHVPGRALSTVTLATVDDVMAGSIIMPDAVYTIRSTGGTTHEVSQVDQSRFLPEGESIPVSTARGQSTGADPLPSADGTSPTIDVMVLYTAAASASAGGEAAIAARINLGISEANTSYVNSSIAQRLRLVHSEQVVYTEHNDLSVDLDTVTNDNGSTPLGNQAALLRNIHGADLVMLVTAAGSPNYCGISWMMESVGSWFEQYAFSVVDEPCISPNSSFAHELGHNMGARHDWYVDNSTTPHTYAHGYVNTTARWRTVMAYNNVCSAQSFSCTRILYWANPAVTYGGAPMGIPGGTKSNCPTGNVNNISCDADDHRTLNDTAATVVNFRKGWRRAASDITGDLKSDILWRGTAGDLWLWPMNGAAWGPEAYGGTVGDLNWQIRSLGDQTGDGKADILWRHTTTGAMYLWPGGIQSAEAYVGTVPVAYAIVGTADYDGDGKADLLWRHVTQGDLWLWLMDGATRLSETYVGTVDPVYVIRGSGDLDGDRKADLVWQHASQGDVWVWLMAGATRVSETYVTTVGDLGYQVKGVADFTGDEKADILWRHATRGDVWLWTMSGGTRESDTYVATVDAGYDIAGIGDCNGDGKADVLRRHTTQGDVWLWLMDGATRMSEAYVATVPVGYQIITVK